MFVHYHVSTQQACTFHGDISLDTLGSKNDDTVDNVLRELENKLGEGPLSRREEYVLPSGPHSVFLFCNVDEPNFDKILKVCSFDDDERFKDANTYAYMMEDKGNNWKIFRFSLLRSVDLLNQSRLLFVLVGREVTVVISLLDSETIQGKLVTRMEHEKTISSLYSWIVDENTKNLMYLRDEMRELYATARVGMPQEETIKKLIETLRFLFFFSEQYFSMLKAITEMFGGDHEIQVKLAAQVRNAGFFHHECNEKLKTTLRELSLIHI